MPRVLASLTAAASLALVILAASACGPGGARGAGAHDLSEARGRAQDALEKATAAEDRLDELAADLEARSRTQERSLARLGRRLNAVTRRLQRSLAALKESVAATERSASEAKGALAEVQQVARDLAVLDRRLDYHLRSHGSRG